MKAKNIIVGKEIEVKIVDRHYDIDKVEVEVMEGIFKGKYCIVNENDLVIVKVNAKLEMVKANSEEYRAIAVDVKTTNDIVLDDIMDLLERKLSNEGFELQFARCPYNIDNMVADTLYVPFVYGTMNDTKKVIKSLWKEVKRDLFLK